MKKFAWITWERQPRNVSMAKLLDCDYYEFNYTGKTLERYWKCLRGTLEVFKKDYTTVFVQNPSIVLSFSAVILKRVFSKKVVIDAHNAGVRPKEGKNYLLQKINQLILASADCTIVSNSVLSNYLTQNNIRNFIISDPLPDLNVQETFPPQRQNVLVICSWSEDEPINAYLEAAKKLPDIEFRFTGNFKKHFQNSVETPKNVILLGFVSEEDYISYLNNATTVLDLTTRSDCLVCGAYEALSIGKPVILTDNEVNRSVFTEFAFYSFLDSESIASTVMESIYKANDVSSENFKSRYNALISARKDEFLRTLG